MVRVRCIFVDDEDRSRFRDGFICPRLPTAAGHAQIDGCAAAERIVRLADPAAELSGEGACSVARPAASRLREIGLGRNRERMVVERAAVPCIGE